MTDNLQEAFYDGGRDYDYGSPHLMHRNLNQVLLRLVTDTMSEASDKNGLPREILEVGGGDGALTGPLLAAGFAVTSTEMSEASVQRMDSRFGRNVNFRAIHDPDGSLAALENDRFSGILFASVLHHIPDYLSALSQSITSHLRPHGSLVTIQDPLWYPRLSPRTRKASSASYLSWRLVQGDLLRGFKTRFRRAISGYSDDEISDAVEYHVVRDGVDEMAIASRLRPLFRDVEIHPYWSTQGRPQQRGGEAMGLRNTFALTAVDLNDPEAPASAPS